MSNYRNSTPPSNDRLALQALLTIATALLRMQMDITELKAMAKAQASPNPLSSSQTERASTRWQKLWRIARAIKSALPFIRWALSTKWGQAGLALISPALSLEIKYQLLTGFLKKYPWGLL